MVGASWFVNYIVLFLTPTDIRDRVPHRTHGPAHTPLPPLPVPSTSDAAFGPEASWRNRESKRAVVIWRLAQERRNGLRRHGGLTAKGKGARAGFKHDPTHLAALAACTQASLANS